MVDKTSTQHFGYAERLKDVLFIPEKRDGEERWRNGTSYSITVTIIHIIFYPGFMRLFILSIVFFFFIIQMAGKPQWSTIVRRLKEIRHCNEILRCTELRRSPNNDRLTKYIISCMIISVKCFRHSCTKTIIQLVE